MIAANPVLVKELRTRMRGVRAYWIVAIYLGVLSLALAFVYYRFCVAWANAAPYGGGLPRTSDVGKTMFSVLAGAQAALIALIAPALTAGAISGEREQRSYEILASSPLTAGAVVRGKLAATALFMLLLIGVSLPLASVALLFGGVSADQVIPTYLLLAASVLTYSALGLFWSAAVRRTAGATVGAYSCAAVVFLGSLYLGRLAINGESSGMPMQSFNPLIGAARAVEPEYFFRWAPPSWIPALVGNLLVGSLLAVMAAERMEDFRARQPALRRALASLLWTVGWASVCGLIAGYYGYKNLVDNHRGERYGSVAELYSSAAARSDLMPIFAYLILALFLVIPILLTADGADASPPTGAGARARLGCLAQFARPLPFLEDTLAGGITLVALWAAVPFVFVFAGTALIGGWELLLIDDTLPAAAAVTAAFVLAGAGIAVFWSAARRRRWQACAWSYATLALLALAPYALLIDPTAADTSAVLPRHQAAYLLPALAISRLASAPPYAPVLRFDGRYPMWQVTAAIYVLIGLAAWFAAAWIGSRRPSKRTS